MPVVEQCHDNLEPEVIFRAIQDIYSHSQTHYIYKKISVERAPNLLSLINISNPSCSLSCLCVQTSWKPHCHDSNISSLCEHVFCLLANGRYVINDWVRKLFIVCYHHRSSICISLSPESRSLSEITDETESKCVWWMVTL